MSEYNETVITPLEHGAAWWTTGKKNSRRTALGATAIVVLLALITWIIWVSPNDNPVRKLVGDVVKPVESSLSLGNDRASLLNELASTKSKVSVQSTELASQKKQLASAVGKAKALEAQLSVAKAAASKAEGQARSLKALVEGKGGHSVQNAGSSGTGGTGSTGNAGGSGSNPGGGTGGGGTGGSTPPPIGPQPVTTPTLASIINPTSRYFGLYTSQSPFSWSEFDEVATKVGAQPNISGYFQGWDTDFRADAVQRSWAKGDLPMMTWESQPLLSGNNNPNQKQYSLSNIINGNFDAYLKKYADAIVANGQPMAIRLDQEMNATWYPWAEDDGHGKSINGNSAGQYVEMWKHVHDLFQKEGANNLVAWVWAPNRVDNLTTTHKTLDYTKSLYPGDDYVDWIGMSGYERPSAAGNQDGSFAQTFAATLSLLRQVAHKPIILAEVGATEVGPAGASIKPGWITNLFNALAEPENSDIIGFSWFNLTVTTSLAGQTLTNDWRITSTQASVAAFAAGISRTDIGYSLRPASP